jgi:ribonuclease G
VRIEDVGRTSATAALVDAEPQVSEEGDALPSKAKRRGRRGGRRRSRAKAETTGSE